MTTTKPTSPAPRKGATTRAKVPVEIKQALECGELETANLMEGLTIDFDVLLERIAPHAPRLEEQGIVRRMKEAGGHLRDWQSYAHHPSDTVRGWAAYKLAATHAQDANQLLVSMKTFAADSHFGVREWAWMAARPTLMQDLELALLALSVWAQDDDANVRRFASEVTRPRGVWCAHIEVLKRNPERGLPILEPLRSDPSKYVRDSVANWLNDVAKTDEAWVRTTTTRWLHDANTQETQAIVKRALRNLR